MPADRPSHDGKLHTFHLRGTDDEKIEHGATTCSRAIHGLVLLYDFCPWS
jgi:hypothetical protein